MQTVLKHRSLIVGAREVGITELILKDAISVHEHLEKLNYVSNNLREGLFPDFCYYLRDPKFSKVWDK